MTILAVALYGLALPLVGLGGMVGTLATLLRDPGLLRWSQGCLVVAFTATAGYFALEGYASWAVVFAGAVVLFAWLWWRQRKRRDPRHRESGTKVSRGRVTKQGSRLLRWAVIEAIQRVPRDSVIGGVKDAIITRRGKEARNIAKVAAARHLLTLVFYGMRDGQIRCLPAAGRGRAA
jgi:hypothetical protein